MGATLLDSGRLIQVHHALSIGKSELSRIAALSNVVGNIHGNHTS